MGGVVMSKKEPYHGRFTEVAKIVGCTRQTVAKAIRENAPGPKCNRARKVYYAKYGNDNQDNNQ